MAAAEPQPVLRAGFVEPTPAGAPILVFGASKSVMAPVPPDVIPQQLARATRVPSPVEATDADLLRAISEGSEPAFEELRHRYRRAVERACRSIVGGEL